jgi:GT2 family glycosyltransferase
MEHFGPTLAFVLTYNRKEMVADCLRAILAQSEPPDAILVVDNASTDGTRAYLRDHGLIEDPRIKYLEVAKNLGAAGGFDLGIRVAHKREFDWVWMMDDDVIPGPDALKELKIAFRENFSDAREVGFLASKIYSGDGKPNNVPDLDTRAPPNQWGDWARLLGAGLVKVRWSTLSSILIPRTTFAAVGSTSPDFFFSGDDIDFTLRITDRLPGYLVGKSVVTHLRAVPGIFSVLRETDPRRIKLFWYAYRNQLYIRRKFYSGRVILFVCKSAWELVKALGTRPYPLLRARSIIGGVFAGLVFSPRYRDIDAPFDAPAKGCEVANEAMAAVCRARPNPNGDRAIRRSASG